MDVYIFAFSPHAICQSSSLQRLENPIQIWNLINPPNLERERERWRVRERDECTIGRKLLRSRSLQNPRKGRNSSGSAASDLWWPAARRLQYLERIDVAFGFEALWRNNRAFLANVMPASILVLLTAERRSVGTVPVEA